MARAQARPARWQRRGGGRRRGGAGGSGGLGWEGLHVLEVALGERYRACRVLPTLYFCSSRRRVCDGGACGARAQSWGFSTGYGALCAARSSRSFSQSRSARRACVRQAAHLDNARTPLPRVGHCNDCAVVAAVGSARCARLAVGRRIVAISRRISGGGA